MSKFIKVMIEVLVFTSIIGIIATSVSNPNENLSGAALVMYGLITLFVVIGFVVYIMKTMGLSGR